MKRNMGTIDRALRVILAITVWVLYLNGFISGTTAVVLGVLAFIFIVTGATGFCPLYAPFGISTIKKEAK